MSRNRLSKKQLREDRFVRQTFDWVHWGETHRNHVIAGVLAVALVVAGFFVYRGMSQGAEARAATDYLTARQAFFSGNYPLAASDLQSFASRHGDSSYADDARFFTALSQYRAGQYEDAIRTLRDFLERHDDSPFADNARWLLAGAYEQAGQLDQAVQIYADAIDKAELDPMKVRLHRSLAAVYAAQSRNDLAAEQYRAILALEPEGGIAEEARRELAELTIEPLAPADAGTAEADPAPPANAAPGASTSEEPAGP